MSQETWLGLVSANKDTVGSFVITTFIQGVCLCLLWPNSRLFPSLPWLSHCSQPLYQHSVRNSVLWNQIVYTSDGRQCYIPARVLSDDTKVMKCGYTSYELAFSTVCIRRKQWECVCEHYAFYFLGNPLMTQRPAQGLTPNRWPKTPPTWDTTYSQVTGGVFSFSPRCDNSGNFSDCVSFLLHMQCAAWVDYACVFR